MKGMKKLTALLMSGVLMLGLASCGSKDDGKDPAETLGAAVAKLSEAKSVDVKSKMDMEMSMMDQTIAMSMDMDMSVFNDPVKLCMESDINVPGTGATKMSIYVQPDGDQYIMYLNAGDGNWVSQKMAAGDLDEVAELNAQNDIELYTKHMEDLTVKEEDGKTRFDGVIKGAAIEEAVKASGALENMGTAEVDPEMLKGMFEDMEGLPISVWVDPESGYPVRYSMDMTGVMSGMMDKIMSSVGGDAASGLKLNVSKMLIEMEYSNFDAATDFEIPAEALGAAA